MEILFAWLAFSILAGWIASSKDRSGVGIFFLSIILSPLIGIIVALVLTRENAPLLHPAEEIPAPHTHRRCPDCREVVRRDAKKCKHCGSMLVPQEVGNDDIATTCLRCNRGLPLYARKCACGEPVRNVQAGRALEAPHMDDASLHLKPHPDRAPRI